MSALYTFFRWLRLLWLSALLLVCLLVERSCRPVAPTATCFQEPKPAEARRQPWRGFHGPAYLQYPLPRKPKQARLDSLARVLRFRKV